MNGWNFWWPSWRKPSDTEGHQHYISRAEEWWYWWYHYIRSRCSWSQESDLEMFNYMSWLFCHFPKASWVESINFRNPINPNRSSLYKWKQGSREEKRSYWLVFELERTPGFCTLLENLSSRCLPQSRPWELPGALLSPLFLTLLLLNHPAFSTDQLSLTSTCLPSIPSQIFCEMAPCKPEPPQQFSLICVLFWTSRKPAMLITWLPFSPSPVWMIQNTEGRLQVSVNASHSYLRLGSVLRLPNHQ